MLLLGPLGFAAPWVLAALIALPVLWLILRATPPAPRQRVFPGVALLLGLADRRPVAQRTPWWLLLLRIAAIAALILAFAGPVWKPVIAEDRGGPLLVVLDAGWGAAPDWPARQARAERALTEAAADGRPAALLLADGRDGADAALPFLSPSELLAPLRAAVPAPWATAYPRDAAQALAQAPGRALWTLWISDGMDHPGRAALLGQLSARGPVQVVPPARLPLTLALQDGAQPALRLHGLADGTSDGAAPAILAIGPDPQGIERELARLTLGTNGGAPAAGPAAAAAPAPDAPAGSPRDVPIDLPPELRNRITRFAIEGQAHAGAVVLADDRTRRHKVGLVGDSDRQAEGQQLLSPLFYLRRALAPTTDLVEGGLGDVLEAAPDVVVLVDQVSLPEIAALAAWVENGGLLIRFAGPRMAADQDLASEPLLPVALRQGGRDIGGALSWGDPRGLTPFDADGPFAGLQIPDEVQVRAQLMAQPAPDLRAATIASLADNTPLVTRARQGAGQVVLFHVTANAEWSNLPISGLFVQMLDRLIALAGSAPGRDTATGSGAGAGRSPDAAAAPFWTPVLVLDGFGRAAAPDDPVPVPAAALVEGPGAGPDIPRPAGVYQAGERSIALNAGGPVRRADWPGAQIIDTAATPGRDLTGGLLAAAALLLALDALASALLAGGGRRGGGRHRGGAPTAVALVLGLALTLTLAALPAPRATAQDVAAAPPASAQDLTATPLDPELVRAANEVALAYVATGDDAVDEVSRQGLLGLSQILRQRTSVEPGAPVAVALDRDDLSVLTLLYWPITAEQPAPGPQAYLRLNHYLRSGGMILFDTRDGDVAGLGGPDMSQALQRLAAPLDIPPLAPLPADHVLTRTFYLLQDFPGRWQGNPVWAEAPPPDAIAEDGVPFRNLNDGVSPVIIGGNDWAEAWAVDADGFSLLPVGRGWQGEEQREQAYRFGVNLVMYVLTGNYKSDQVHVPALLDRLRVEEGAIR